MGYTPHFPMAPRRLPPLAGAGAPRATMASRNHPRQRIICWSANKKYNTFKCTCTLMNENHWKSKCKLQRQIQQIQIQINTHINANSNHHHHQHHHHHQQQQHHHHHLVVIIVVIVVVVIIVVVDIINISNNHIYIIYPWMVLVCISTVIQHRQISLFSSIPCHGKSPWDRTLGMLGMLVELRRRAHFSWATNTDHSLHSVATLKWVKSHPTIVSN